MGAKTNMQLDLKKLVSLKFGIHTIQRDQDYLAPGSLVADLVQGVDEDTRGGAGGEGQPIIHNEALAQLQQDEDADERYAQQVRDRPPQLRIIHILRHTYVCYIFALSLS